MWLADDGKARIARRIVVITFAAQHRRTRPCGYDRRFVSRGVPA